MKIVFSRKGWDSGAGGAASPILNGMPVSLPIPGSMREPRRFADIDIETPGGTVNLGDLAAKISRGRVPARQGAHDDPMFHLSSQNRPRAALGQTGAAQSHLDNMGVGAGDVFLFFGLFRDYCDPGAQPHHRIFGAMRIQTRIRLGATPDPDMWRDLDLPCTHRHLARPGQRDNNTLWLGPGYRAHRATPALRLTRDEARPSLWSVPDWLRETGLSYHANPDRWGKGTLRSVSRGQEFVSDIGNSQDHPARAWLDAILHEIAS